MKESNQDPVTRDLKHQGPVHIAALTRYVTLCTMESARESTVESTNLRIYESRIWRKVSLAELCGYMNRDSGVKGPGLIAILAQ